jgi:hypothetical protein
MGFTTFALASVYDALTVRSEPTSVFSVDTFDDAASC